jgi:hypothetical protein
MFDRNNNYGNYRGRFPAVVKKYDAEKRMCRVEIPGITGDSSDIESLPWAEIEYPIGDKSRKIPPTEIDIIPDDPVWVDFINADQRYPIITGWRNPRRGNSEDWRRWRHDNVEIIARDAIRLVCGTSSIEIYPDHIWIDAVRIDLNTEHARPFLEVIAGWEKTIADLKAQYGSD